MVVKIRLGASQTIGSYILPGEPLTELSEIINGQIKLTILNCDKIIEGVKSGIFDVGLIESAIFDDALIYTKWIEDELVVCSKTSLGESIDKEMIGQCQLLCRRELSPTRLLITNFFKEHGLSYHHFGSLMEVDNAISAIQGIKWSKPNRLNPTVTIVSRLAIEDELKRKELYFSRINRTPIHRDFYIIHNKKHKDTGKIEKILNYFIK
ncbi:LysR substrate-binding domain-containing protein [Sulfurovum sp. zt1-1]|uniref:LysR substrate-binding domain-containing protein n=1 Tax=Sulfurovum zhangzhouensis TaxID=3019067 RepID=A0ABT7QV55_9BACT|nr:LysR substrate-binding domain-containing protein [Sulfurovum zhangzhouensis]MDM5270719.1 LysR substrate-binding domain-containing protein [Sulfurovum zhangzhouensis]